MFEKDIYIARRNRLKKQVEKGIVLFIGNGESPMNYSANTFPFRQDSSFLYFWGIDLPGFAALIDIDNGEEIVFGNDFDVDDIVWMGPQKRVAELAQEVGVSRSEPMDKLKEIAKASIENGRKIHYLPQYRADNIIALEELTGIPNAQINVNASTDLIRAVVEQRSIKSTDEIIEIEKALTISYQMNKIAMKLSKPGIYEREVYGAIEGVVLSSGSYVSFPVIFSIHGETLHNHGHDNLMKDGDMLVLDSGAESPLHYASDITRTFPVSGKFTDIQKDIYNVVLRTQEESIKMMKPGVYYKDVHMNASRIIAEGMKQLGFIKGNIDDVIDVGAHALFFPHGLGHMLGLDVHDMENLGEDYVGYNTETERSDQFGLAYLRLARRLQPGFIVTVEPGIYFIPELIDLWKAENKFSEFIDYNRVDKYRDFGGIRIEDDVLVTDDGHRVLGFGIAKSVDDVEEWSVL